MISTVYLGGLAALFVLIFPMCMAGLHLSRNKLLFFSCSLFISLAVLVHVTPYLPSLSLFPTPSPHPSCLALSHPISWSHQSNLSTWHWSPPCRFRDLPPSLLLNRSSLLVAGDSQARLFTLALLSLLLPPPSLDAARANLSRRHSDYGLLVEDHSLRLDFLWSPFVPNLTAALASPLPDVLVMGAGLWHMLHFTNASDYGRELRDLARSVSRLPPPLPRMFWLGMPELVNQMLNTEEKRERMSPEVCREYEREVVASGLLRGSGGPFVLLDVGRLSRSCGVRCTEDGMHYGEFVYDAAVQVMLNVMLIESQEMGVR